MEFKLSRAQREIFQSIGLLAVTFALAIPLMDFDNTANVVRALTSDPVSCEQDLPRGPIEAIALLSAGRDKINTSVPNYQEMRRIDALVYEYLHLLESGTPPRVIILALDDGPIKDHIVRNRIQLKTNKLSHGSAAIENEAFVTVFADHTDDSLALIAKTLQTHDIQGPISLITSEPHVNRLRYNTCRRQIPGIVVSANRVLAENDPDTYAEMRRQQNLPSYQWAKRIEMAKILFWLYRPNY